MTLITDDDELGAAFARCYKHTAFRLEQLPAYEVPSDHKGNDPAQVSDYDRWLDGAVEPLWERKEPFLNVLRTEREAGKLRYRVRILGGPQGLHPYEQYEAAFGYVPNHKAGEGIFILDRGLLPVPPPVPAHDFWLLDDRAVLAMMYSQDGEYEGAFLWEDDPGALAKYRAARNALMGCAEPFPTWWARHVELHRSAGQVAA